MELGYEFTIEAGRPDSITREKLEVMYNHGVRRISVNPQTMQQKTLDLIGRHAAAIVVHQRAVAPLIVHQLAGVLLHVPVHPSYRS